MNNQHADEFDEALDRAIEVITSSPLPAESRDALLSSAASWPNNVASSPPKRSLKRVALLASLAASLLIAGGYKFLMSGSPSKDRVIGQSPTVAQLTSDDSPGLNTIEDHSFQFVPSLQPGQKRSEYPAPSQDESLGLYAAPNAPAVTMAGGQKFYTRTQLEELASNELRSNPLPKSADDLLLDLTSNQENPSKPGPITPSGIPVTDETPLEPGVELLVEYHGQWWRGAVKELGPGKDVSIRYCGWEETWDEVVPRTRLQLNRQTEAIAEISEGIPSIPESPRSWGPEQAVGPPNTLEAGDQTTAWASLTPDGADEWLILEYDRPVHAVAILIFETFNPGSLSKVHLWNEQNQDVLVWTGNPICSPGQRAMSSAAQKRVVAISTQGQFATKKVRLDLASKAVRGWNEIDAVGLVDDKGVTHWATRAVASSSYAVHQTNPHLNNDAAKPPRDKPTTLADAVRAFNQKAAQDPIGKDQPPLTQEAVIAAIRWSTMDQVELQLTDETMRMLDKITRTRQLPKGFTLEYISRFEPNDHTQFDAWSVRLRVPGGTIQNGTTCIMIENRMIRSQTAGPHEREVIEKWRKRNEGRAIGLGMPDEDQQRQFQRYLAEREKAAEQDRAEQK